MNERNWQTHIDILGWLYLLSNAFLLVIGIIGLLLFAGIGIAFGEPEAAGILGVIGVAGLVFFTILAVPGLLTGYGLLKRHSWARILALVVGFFSLANFPIGSIIGVYTYVVLLQAGITDHFDTLKTA
ncbi:MAG: hypothetical protein JSV68_03235 [Anaerolineaceae bacterium]|nr:MAG: hypothetical protein JSV68_03235 [Anaerolineaceae bacterium]